MIPGYYIGDQSDNTIYGIHVRRQQCDSTPQHRLRMDTSRHAMLEELSNYRH